MKDSFKEIIHFRHACKVFDAHKKIPSEELKLILESARLAPSSFGIEPWKFLVIQDGALKSKLSKTCWNPTKLEDCSDVVVLLVCKNLKSTNSHVQNIFKSRMDNPKPVIKRFSEFMDNRSEEEINCWASRQVYIASAFLMMGAASVGVDSCPIEGFDVEKATEVLEIDRDEFEIAHLVALGFRGYEQPERFRLDFDEVVEFR